MCCDYRNKHFHDYLIEMFFNIRITPIQNLSVNQPPLYAKIKVSEIYVGCYLDFRDK